MRFSRTLGSFLHVHRGRGVGKEERPRGGNGNCMSRRRAPGMLGAWEAAARWVPQSHSPTHTVSPINYINRASAQSSNCTAYPSAVPRMGRWGEGGISTHTRSTPKRRHCESLNLGVGPGAYTASPMVVSPQGHCTSGPSVGGHRFGHGPQC